MVLSSSSICLVLLLSALCLLLSSSYASASASTVYYICEAGDPTFLGTYTKAAEQSDGIDVYTNDNEMSIFRSKKFWYIGDLT